MVRDPYADDPAKPAQALPPGAYQAVVHFHGMGDQRRHAEISQLVDALDLWAQPGREADYPPGRIRDITGRFDQGGISDADYLAHAELKHQRDKAPRAGEPVVTGDLAFSKLRYRFYEAYWAPVAASEIPARDVLTWLVGNTMRPLSVWRSSWRDHGHLRRTLLDADSGIDDRTRQVLVERHLEFERPSARRAHPRGSFTDFMSFVAGTPDSRAVLAADLWRRRVRTFLVTYQLMLLSFVLLLVELTALTAWLVLAALEALSGDERFATMLGDRFEPTWGNAAAIAGTLLLGVVAGGFLRRSLGDVLYWASLRETDERNATRRDVLAVAVDTLRKVLEDPLCQRVVVTAHSLGTTIAYEALLEIGRINTASNREHAFGGVVPVRKLDHFITWGSPIDKIHFLFESQPETSSTFSTLSEELHLDVGQVPFMNNRLPHVHWINIWDRADAVSGPLASPRSMRHDFDRPAVDNVEVRMLKAPEPGTAHTTYLDDARVVEVVYDAIFHQRYSYWPDPAARGEARKVDVASKQVGDIDVGEWTRGAQAVVLALPWLAPLTLWAWLAGGWSLTTVLLAVVSGSIVAAVLVGAVFLRGHRFPLLLPSVEGGG